MKYGNEGLMAEGTFVKGIAEKTKAEDCEGKSVAGSERIAIEEAGKCLIVVFLAGNDAEKIHQFCSLICELTRRGSQVGKPTSRMWG